MTSVADAVHANRIVRSLTASEIAAYREAVRTGMSRLDESSLTSSPVHPFVLAFRAFEQLMATLNAPNSIHLSQEILVQRPVRPDERVTVEVEILGARREARGVRLALRCVLVGADGSPFAELATGVLLVDATAPEPFGTMPAQAIPGGDGSGQSTVLTRQISAETVRRYAEVSGDGNPVHLDAQAAEAAGFPGIIAHGMCVLATVCEEAIDLYAPGGAAQVRGVGARFSAPVLPDEAIAVTFEPDEAHRVIRFFCRTAQGIAIKGGWIEFCPAEGLDGDD